MIKKISFMLFFSFLLSLSLSAQPIQKGPYTVKKLTENVYNIEDANDSNPSGIVTGDDGQIVRMNNSSDIYLIRGSKKALLIDLSNDVKWDKTTGVSLRSIVDDLIGSSELFITITHNHGDHLGMLPVFKDDSGVKFWIPENEFKGKDIFPKKRTSFFPQNASFDLGGGMKIDTLEVPGHTAHSTVFFLENKNIVFTGDAVGSGSGVWLFNKESFYTYIESINTLIRYIKSPEHDIDETKLVIYGGHGWQRGNLEKLTMQYIYDMESLIERMGLGIAESEKMSVSIPFMDTKFKFGTAAISWNKEAEEEYAESIRKEMGKFTRISKHKDYGMAITRLVVDLGKDSIITEKDLTGGTFKVIGINKSNKAVRNIKALSVTDRQGYDIDSGNHVTIDLDFGFDADPSNASFLVVTLNRDMGKYPEGTRFIQHGRTLRK